MLLANKICVITGAASQRGIGRAIAKLFALHGGRSIILDLDAQQASAAASELGDAHRGLACDVTDKNACIAAIERVVGEFGRVDVLVNNAGITQPLKFMDIAPENYDAVLDVNLRGTLYMSQAAIPQMRQQRSGSIVCMSSVSAQRGGGVFGKVPYSSAKAAILGFTKALAREIADTGVTVNAVTPGAVDTAIRVGSTDEQEAKLARDIPVGRTATTDEVAAVITFFRATTPVT